MRLSLQTLFRVGTPSRFLLAGVVLGVVVGGACATVLCVAGDIEAKLVYVPGGRWDLESELTLGEWSGWDLAVALEIEACRWKRIEAEVSFEWLHGEISSMARWDPRKGTFAKWTVDGSLERVDTTFAVGFDLSLTRCWTDLEMKAETGGCQVEIELRLGASRSFCFDFYRIDVDVSFEASGLPIDVESRLSAKKGFEWIEVEAGIPVPVTWLGVEVAGRWAAHGRTVSFEPELEAEAMWEAGGLSLELFGEIVSGSPIALLGLTIAGVRVEGAWGDLQFAWGTSFDRSSNKAVTGKSAYGAIAEIGFDGDMRCGGEVSLGLVHYAADPSIFVAWDRTVWSASWEPEGSPAFDLEVTLDGREWVEISAGIDVDW